MSCSKNAKSKQIGMDLPHVFVSSSQNEDHVKKPSSKDSPQNVVHLIDQNSPVRSSVCHNQGKEIDSSVALHGVVV